MGEANQDVVVHRGIRWRMWSVTILIAYALLWYAAFRWADTMSMDDFGDRRRRTRVRLITGAGVAVGAGLALRAAVGRKPLLVVKGASVTTRSAGYHTRRMVAATFRVRQLWPGCHWLRFQKSAGKGQVGLLVYDGDLAGGIEGLGRSLEANGVREYQTG